MEPSAWAFADGGHVDRATCVRVGDAGRVMTDLSCAVLFVRVRDWGRHVSHAAESIRVWMEHECCFAKAARRGGGGPAER